MEWDDEAAAGRAACAPNKTDCCVYFPTGEECKLLLRPGEKFTYWCTARIFFGNAFLSGVHVVSSDVSRLEHGIKLYWSHVHGQNAINCVNLRAAPCKITWQYCSVLFFRWYDRGYVLLCFGLADFLRGMKNAGFWLFPTFRSICDLLQGTLKF